MGTIKKSLISFLNKRNFFLIKTYAFYRKDIWGFLKVKRSYKYKRFIYSMLKRKRRFYGIMLYKVYKGIKFFNKDFNYRANLMVTKKRLKLFYGFLRDTYFGKLGQLVKRKHGVLIDYFYSILERRIDVILYRAHYTFSVRYSQHFLKQKRVILNSKLIILGGVILYVGDLIRLRVKSMGNIFFFKYDFSKSLETYKFRNYLFHAVKKCFIRWFYFKKFIYKFLSLFINLNYNPKSYKNRKKLYFKDLYSILYLIFNYSYFILKKRTRFFKIKKKYKKFFYKKPYFSYFRRLFIFFVKKLVIIFFFLKKKIKLIPKFNFQLYRLYGLFNLKMRLKKMYYILRPKWYNRVYTKIQTKRKYKILKKKKYRIWRFSKNVYNLFKNISSLYFLYKGYLSYLEINYKIHIILIVAEPKLHMIHYNLGVDKLVFFDYFRRKAYF